MDESAALADMSYNCIVTGDFPVRDVTIGEELMCSKVTVVDLGSRECLHPRAHPLQNGRDVFRGQERLAVCVAEHPFEGVGQRPMRSALHHEELSITFKWVHRGQDRSKSARTPTVH